VFGQASLADRVGVWSIYRNGEIDGDETERRKFLRRTLKTALHETGHMLGIPHCIAFECGMNGSNKRFCREVRTHRRSGDLEASVQVAGDVTAVLCNFSRPLNLPSRFLAAHIPLAMACAVRVLEDAASVSVFGVSIVTT
jgi:hypothetical protein